MLQPKLNEPFNLENIFSTNNNWKHFDATKIINENNETLNEGTILSNIYQDEMI
jgi:hypothetical protein